MNLLHIDSKTTESERLSFSVCLRQASSLTALGEGPVLVIRATGQAHREPFRKSPAYFDDL